VLGRISEESLHKALGLWGWQFFLRPLSLILIAMIIFTIAFAVWKQSRQAKRMRQPQLSAAQ
jgi:putative tricarboxylic transport membrane protein